LEEDDAAMTRLVLVLSAVTLPLVALAVFFAMRGGERASAAGPAPVVAEETGSISTSTSNSTSNAATTSTSTSTNSEPQLEDGRHFGFIKSADLESSPHTLVFDLAYLLTGDAANREAAERGYPTPVDNDYFIVNDNPKLRTLPLSSDVELRLLDWKHCCDTFFSGDLDRFAAAFARNEYPAGNYKGKFTAYRLTVEHGVVVKVDEHYFP
jgi:hypothetical protein